MLVLHAPEQVARDARFPARVAFLPTSAFRTVLLNVGLARTLLTGQRAEAFSYTAPERIRAAPVDGRADIYSLGVLAYQMLAGMLPFHYPNPGATLIAHLRQPPPDPRSRVPTLSAETAMALLRALAKDPRERFGTAGEFVAQLQ
jgi:serine/threonine-protein kinase